MPAVDPRLSRYRDLGPVEAFPSILALFDTGNSHARGALQLGQMRRVLIVDPRCCRAPLRRGAMQKFAYSGSIVAENPNLTRYHKAPDGLI